MTNSQAPQPEHLPLAVSSAPRHIWLDLGFDPAEEDAHFSNLHALTWSEDNASGHGIKYVRADLAGQAIPAPEGADAALLALLRAAFDEGFGSRETYNDVVTNTAEDAWATANKGDWYGEKVRAALAAQPMPAAVPPSDMQRWVQAEALVESLGWTWNAASHLWEAAQSPAEGDGQTDLREAAKQAGVDMDRQDLSDAVWVGYSVGISVAQVQPASYRQDYPTSAAVLGAEQDKAREDQRLFGVGFCVNGWHVPALVVACWGMENERENIKRFEALASQEQPKGTVPPGYRLVPEEFMDWVGALPEGKAQRRLAWLHSTDSNNVDGWTWGVYRVKYDEAGQMVSALHSYSDFSDLDAAMAATSPHRPSAEWYRAKIAETEGIDDNLPCGALAVQAPAPAPELQDAGEAAWAAAKRLSNQSEQDFVRGAQWAMQREASKTVTVRKPDARTRAQAPAVGAEVPEES